MKEAKMSFKKILAVAAVTGLVTAMALPALALENEFHGMFKFIGYETNFFNGISATVAKDAHSGFVAEQRARIQYTAKASDDLKLVTHFELDSRFGGVTGGYKGITTGNDSGNLDADSLTLETKSVYLDFNCPITGANVKAGLQPWGDAYKGVFLSADMTGAYLSKKLDPLTLSAGWFRMDDNTAKGTTDVGQSIADLFVGDAKFAVNSDITVGASYYFVNNDTTTDVPGAVTGIVAPVNVVDNMHVFGVNASIKAGPATIDPFAAVELGDTKAPSTSLHGWMAGATGKVKVGTGNVNVALLYLSGDDGKDNNIDSFGNISPFTSYFNPANMWLLVRSGQAINSSTSVLGNDITVGGHGLMGAFLGYDGTADKLFYNANVGYAQAAEKFDGSGEKKELGTEINAQIGYKLYDNLSMSVAGAYVFLGKGLSGNASERLFNGYDPAGVAKFGATDADDVWMSNVQLSYTF